MVEPLSSLAASVRRALAEDQRTASATVDVTVNRRIVTLSGSVQDRQAFRAATAIAESQRGVLEVVNNLDVVGAGTDEPLSAHRLS